MTYQHIFSFCAAAFLLTACQLTTQAQTGQVNGATTAVPFLKISPDARAGGMGDMGVATEADVNSSFHNLAKLPFATQQTALGGSYTSWMHDVVNGMYLASIAGYHQLDEKQTIGASLRYFNMGDFPVTDYRGNKLQTEKPREFAFDLGYARKLSSALSIAATVRYISSDIMSGSVNGTEYKVGNAFAADLSLYYHALDTKGQGWSGGLVLANLGTKISYTNDVRNKEFLPATAGLGVGYTLAADEKSLIYFGVEANKLMVPAAPADSANLVEYHAREVMESWAKSFNSGDYQLSAGLEYKYDHVFSARAGYHYADKTQGSQPYFTAGVGFSYNAMSIDFSYLAGSGNGVTPNPLSNSIRLGVNFGLGNKQAK